MTRRLFAYVTILIGLLVFFTWWETAVFAHEAVMIKSNPANGAVLAESPPEVVAWFAEELVTSDSTLTVYNSQGVRVDNGDGGVDLNDPDHASLIVALPPQLPNDSYTVQWHVVLLDSDATNGAFAFVVGEDAVADTISIPQQAPLSENEDNTSTGFIIAAILIFAFVIVGIGMVLLRK